ncbi:hypothetical protein L1987_54270 [Smallanthus sonchifolius]|uniref:Uncharacterized protein n=1 Tax=Smallanthus sonchifolius TaxID=185202 RepID=A0ACB9E6S6_9ASTR|nr:hypothetical protein L1987_54270 [Smallanthus sonchifolius]
MEVKVEEPEFDLSSASERRAARERGKGMESNVEVVVLNEEEIGSGDELNAILEEIDNFGVNDLYPEILATEDLQDEKVRYFTEEGDEIQTLSYDDKTEYDAERKLFIIRRYRGGVQHFKNMADFQTLIFYDLRDLAKLPLQNPGNVMMASYFEHYLHIQVNNDYKGLKHRKTKKKISKTMFIPKTKKPNVFLRWYYNPNIGSAMIECEGKEDMVIFEPTELLKFQPEDLEVLFKNHIQAYCDDDEEDAKAYQRVVTLHVKPYI